MQDMSPAPPDNNSKNTNVNKSLLELRIQELENENNNVLSKEKQKIAQMTEKIDLISTIYECLQDVGTININEGKTRSPKDNNSKKSSKDGDKGDKSIFSSKNSQWELQKLKEEKKQFLAEIKQYKEVLWLQSRTINELTAQQNELMRSVGDYRKGCASRLERIANLSNCQNNMKSTPVQDQAIGQNSETSLILKKQNKGTQTRQLGVTKSVQCFLPTQNIDQELLSLKKRQSEFSQKFEDIVKMVMVNEAGKVTDRYKKLKTGSINNPDMYTRRLVYDSENIGADQSEDEQEGDDLLDQVMAQDSSYRSADLDQTDYFIEAKRLSAKKSAPKLADSSNNAK